MAGGNTHAYVHAAGNVSSSAIEMTESPFSYTATQLQNASKITITATGGNLRYRYDGSDPTASVGHLFLDGVTTEFDRPQDLRVIAESGTVAVTATLDTYT